VPRCKKTNGLTFPKSDDKHYVDFDDHRQQEQEGVEVPGTFSFSQPLIVPNPPLIVASGRAQLTTEELQRALAGVTNAMQQQQQYPSLDKIFSATEAVKFLEDESICNELKSFLPEELQTKEELEHTLTSPQLRQAFVSLSYALMSDNFNTVMSNFQLDPMDGAIEMQRGDGIAAFLKAIQAQADRDQS